ncbi:unnamed protein product [Zymoseptoria tritici ST99CH_3D1]|nr:unnamed protein product [Zymoseptoria tritici ST99CH_3D1]
MESSASLTGVPIEMLELIAQHTGNDMKKLRLVSRHVAAATSKLFKRTFFTDLRVLLATRQSIKKAIEVINDPNLGPAVRRLVLVDDGYLDLDMMEREDWQFYREKDREFFKHELLARHEQRETRTNNEDLRLLIELFRNAGQQKMISALHFKRFVLDDDGRTRGCNYDDWDGNDHCFVTAMRAILRSGAFFDLFSMDTSVFTEAGGGRAGFTGVKVVHFGQETFKGTTCAAAFRRFKALDLTLEAGHGDLATIGRDFLATIPHAKVRSLKVRPMSDWGLGSDVCSPLVINSLLASTLPFMDSFSLRYTETNWKPLLSFLVRQTSLCHLSLFKVLVSNVPKDILQSTSAGGELEEEIVCERLSQLAGITRVEQRLCRMSNGIVIRRSGGRF